MARVHVLRQLSLDTYDVVVHVAMPTTKNAVGTDWRTCYLASFGSVAPKSRLLVGNTAGKISQNEANQIAAGDVIEWSIVAGGVQETDVDARNAMLDFFADQEINQRLANFMEEFKLYGYTRG